MNIDPNELDSYINETAGIEPDQMGSEGGDNNANAGTGTVDDKTNREPSQVPGSDTTTVAKPATQKADTQKVELDAQGKPITKTPTLRPLNDGSFADEKGNIVDDKGNIIAQAGFASRIYNKAQRLERRNAEMEQSLTQLRTQVAEYKVLSSAAQAKGLTSDDLATAIDFAGRIKGGDALSVAKEVVAMAVAAGHNVTEILGKDIGDSIDMRALSTMIDQRLGPIVQQRQQTEQLTEAETRAKAAYDRFVDDNEFADVHAEDIAHLIKTVPGTTPQQAYNTMVRFAHQNQLDFSQPFGPQLEAKERAANPNATQQKPNKPLPNGANGTHLNGGGTNAVELAPADADWSTIIRSAMGTA